MTDDATINGSAVIESLRRDCDLPAAVPDEVIQTAIHEAGHAVTAWALGMPVRTLFILLDGTGGQCMSGDTGHSYFDPARLRSEMVFVAAGTEPKVFLARHPDSASANKTNTGWFAVHRNCMAFSTQEACWNRFAIHDSRPVRS